MSVTLETLNQEYTQLCTQYGDVTLQLEALNRRAVGIKQRVDELSKLQQELLAAKEKEAPSHGSTDL